MTERDRLTQAVVEAARAWLNVVASLPYQDQRELDAMNACETALNNYYALPPEPAGEVMEFAVHQSPSGDTHLVKIGSPYDQTDGFSNNWTRLGTTRLTLMGDK